MKKYHNTGHGDAAMFVATQRRLARRRKKRVTRADHDKMIGHLREMERRLGQQMTKAVQDAVRQHVGHASNHAVGNFGEDFDGGYLSDAGGGGFDSEDGGGFPGHGDEGSLDAEGVPFSFAPLDGDQNSVSFLEMLTNTEEYVLGSDEKRVMSFYKIFKPTKSSTANNAVRYLNSAAVQTDPGFFQKKKLSPNEKTQSNYTACGAKLFASFLDYACCEYLQRASDDAKTPAAISIKIPDAILFSTTNAIRGYINSPFIDSFVDCLVKLDIGDQNGEIEDVLDAFIEQLYVNCKNRVPGCSYSTITNALIFIPRVLKLLHRYCSFKKGFKMLEYWFGFC